ncbi:MAG: hypothetical protein JNG84_04175 [Archangium sp.]|nr:hypothetical protein [Archangium sp.]
MATGDRAGEHTTMERGKGSAWPHVITGAVLFGAIVTFIFSGVLHALVVANVTAVDLGFPMTVLALGLGIGVVAFVYFDRWRVNEAHSSTYGTSPMHLFFVPMISIGYALSRFVERVTDPEK